MDSNGLSAFASPLFVDSTYSHLIEAVFLVCYYKGLIIYMNNLSRWTIRNTMGFGDVDGVIGKLDSFSATT